MASGLGHKMVGFRALLPPLLVIMRLCAAQDNQRSPWESRIDMACSNGEQAMSWELVTENAGWAGRSAMGVLSFEGKMWIMGGRAGAAENFRLLNVNSYSSPPSSVHFSFCRLFLFGTSLLAFHCLLRETVVCRMFGHQRMEQYGKMSLLPAGGLRECASVMLSSIRRWAVPC